MVVLHALEEFSHVQVDPGQLGASKVFSTVSSELLLESTKERLDGICPPSLLLLLFDFRVLLEVDRNHLAEDIGDTVSNHVSLSCGPVIAASQTVLLGQIPRDRHGLAKDLSVTFQDRKLTPGKGFFGLWPVFSLDPVVFIVDSCLSKDES